MRADDQSDFVGYLKLWDFFHKLKAELSHNQLRKACRQNFLSFNRMREWLDVHRELMELVRRAGLSASSGRGAEGEGVFTAEDATAADRAAIRPHPNPLPKGEGTRDLPLPPGEGRYLPSPSGRGAGVRASSPPNPRWPIEPETALTLTLSQRERGPA